MSLIKLLTEQTDKFKLSYRVPYNRVPYLLDKLTKNNPQLRSGEDENGLTYVWNEENNEVLLRYEYESRTLHSDYPFNELLTLGAE